MFTTVSPPEQQDLSWSLIARAAAGDDRARNAFGRGYLGVVRSFLENRWRGTRFAGEIDDAVQEVFVECLREEGALTRAHAERGEFRAFVFGVTRNVALRIEERARLRAARDHGVGSEIDRIHAEELSLSRLFDREWALAIVRLAADRMSASAAAGSAAERLRVELLELRFTRGLAIREIADQWGMDATAVHRAYLTAREEFRVHLRRIVAEHAVRSEEDLDAEVARVFELIG